VTPYLDKNDERQARDIEKLYAQADFLLLPTRADCAPNVFKEANAFGLPVITTATGGVADIVRDGENGYALPHEARGDAYAHVIAAIWHDEARYNQLAQTSRIAYDARLSWDAWAKAISEILHEIY
jgi:glycosyltransferase involved in cell wall biosynthesis